MLPERRPPAQSQRTGEPCDAGSMSADPGLGEVAIVDYGIGNLGSLANALERLEYRPVLVDEPQRLVDFDRVILPGVGHFGACALRVRQTGFEPALVERVQEGRWLLGICVGMQLLFEGSDESEIPGLSLLSGKVERMSKVVRLPEMQWNQLVFDGARHPVFARSSGDVWVYFVHSYAVRESQHAIAWEDYGLRYVAAVAKGPLLGVQFHPEKSGKSGLRVLAGALNFEGEGV